MHFDLAFIISSFSLLHLSIHDAPWYLSRLFRLWDSNKNFIAAPAAKLAAITVSCLEEFFILYAFINYF